MYLVNIGFHIIDVIIRVIIRDKLLLREERVIIVIIMNYFDGDLDSHGWLFIDEEGPSC